MSLTFSYDEAYVTKCSPRRDPVAGKSRTRGRQRAPALVRVPMLDWPGALFSDNVSAAEVACEDFATHWELSDEPYFQVAA